MEILRTTIQLLIALGIFNVWLVRYDKSTSYRGGHAINMKEEFEVYGIPYWFMLLVGGLKLILAILLIIGIWYKALIQPSAITMAILMIAAIAMHFKVKDPISKAIPASTMLLLSLFVTFV
jgi:hypothetical protein